MSLARSFMVVASGTGLSRLLGFGRDIMIAASLGAGPVADAFVVAFRLPNLLRRLVAEGAFNAAFVPLYIKIRSDEGDDSARAFAAQAFAGLLILVLALVGLAEVFMAPLVHAMAPGFFVQPDEAALAIFLSRLAFPFLGFSLLSALFSAVLNSEERYFVAAFAPVVLNLVLIFVLGLAIHQSFAGTLQAAVLLAFGVTIAGLLQSVWCYIGLRQAGLSFGWHMPRFSPQMRQLCWFMLPGLFAGGITQINAFVGSLIGSAAPGVVSHLYYADRVYQLPLGILSVALGQTLLSQLARLLAQGDEKGAIRAQALALEFGLFLTLPAAVALSIAAVPIVSILFERGAFGPESTMATASALKFYALGLPAFIIAKALQPAFFAASQMRAPLIIALLGGLIDVLFAYFSFASLSQSGIALAAALAGWFNALGLGLLLWKTNRLHMSVAALGRLLRQCVSAGIMGLVVWGLVMALVPFWQASQGLLVKLVALTVLVLGGLGVFLCVAWALGCFNWRQWKNSF